MTPVDNSMATGVYQNFDKLPVTGANEIPGDGDGWRYSSAVTNTGHGYYGSCGYWNSENGSVTVNDIHDSFNLYKNGYNTAHMGWTTYQFFNIDDQVAQSGNSLKITVTGGIFGDSDGSNLVTYGLPLFSKEEYLGYLNKGQNPVDSTRKIGHQLIYFTRANLTGSNGEMPIANGANRFEFYVYLPDSIDNDGGAHVTNTFGTGPYNAVANEHFYPEDHPSYDHGNTIGGHWYHDFYTRGGGWTHVQQDSHPSHNNGLSSADRYPYPSKSMRNMGTEYYTTMYRFYFSAYPYTGIAVPPYSIWIDEIEFTYDPEPQNEETINNVSLLMKQDKTFEIGFNDKYKPQSGWAHATYEVRYSFSQITNKNWDAATKVHMLGDQRWSEIHANTDGLMRKVSSYRIPVWAPFSLASQADIDLLVPGKTIYFAIKDVSQSTSDPLDPRQPGWGRDYRNSPEKFDFAGDAPALPLIKRIDYYIAGGSGEQPPPESAPSIQLIRDN